MAQPFVELVPSLVQGISKQAPIIRNIGQVEDANNISFNVVDGARKRPGSQPLTSFSASSSSNYKIHKIERDADKEYAVVYGNGGFVKIVDINTGQQYSPGTAPNSYLNNSTVDQIKFATIADSTFVASTKEIPGTLSNEEQLDPTTMPVLLKWTGSGFTWSTPDWSGRSYGRQIIEPANTGSNWWYISYGSSGQNGVYSTSAPLPSSSSAEWISYALQGNGINPNDLIKEIIYMKTTTTSFTFEGLTNTTSGAEQIRTGTYECIDPLYPNWQGPHPNNPYPRNVAAKAVVGLAAFPYGKVIVSGGPSDVNEVVVYFSPDLDVTAKLDVSYHTVRLGDSVTDPPPRFAQDGIAIKDIGFIRNRLVIAAGETMSFSAVDDMFRFYLDQPPVQTDADPINVQLAAADVCIVDYLVPFRKSIIALTSSGQQFELNGGDVLTPSSVAISPTTKYETQDVRPVAIGNRLYMAGASAGYTTLLEYFHSEASLSNEAANVSQHVGDLIPTGVYSLDASPNQGSVFIVPALTGDPVGRSISSSQDGNFSDASTWTTDHAPCSLDTITLNHTVTIQNEVTVNEDFGTPPASTYADRTMFVYKTYIEGTKRMQSAWSKWDFKDDGIQDVKTFDDTQIILRKNGSRLMLEKIDLSEPTGTYTQSGSTWPFKPHLDHMHHVAAGSYDGSTGKTTFTVSLNTGYSTADIDTIVLANGVEYQKAGSLSDGKFVINGSGNIEVSGSVTGQAGLIGRRIKSELTLTRAFARNERGLPLSEGRTIIRKVVVEHADSASYDIVTSSTIGQISGLTRSETYTPVATTETGRHQAWCQGNAKDTAVSLVSDTAMPATWSAVEQHGIYHSEIRE